MKAFSEWSFKVQAGTVALVFSTITGAAALIAAGEKLEPWTLASRGWVRETVEPLRTEPATRIQVVQTEVNRQLFTLQQTVLDSQIRDIDQELIMIEIRLRSGDDLLLLNRRSELSTLRASLVIQRNRATCDLAKSFNVLVNC